MVLCNSRYKISVNVEVSPCLDKFDVVYNPDHINTSHDFYMARILRIVRSDGHILTTAVLDTVCADTESCAVLAEDILTVVQFGAIVRISLDTGEIVQHVVCDNMGGLMEIHPIEGGYIIRGEGDIFRYDLDLNRIWQSCSRDIFALTSGDDVFWIENSLIHCRDREGWHYVLDYDRKLISETQEIFQDR